MYKLLALDLDGTLLNSDNQISRPLLQAIRNLPDDLEVMLVTGRHHTAAKAYHKQLALNTPIICCNGTYIYDYQSSRVVCENAISKENAAEFLSLCEPFSLKKIIHVTDTMLYDKNNPMAFIGKLHNWATSLPEDDRPNTTKVSDFKSSINDYQHVWKFVIEGQEKEIEQFSRLLVIQKEFNVERSFSNRFDFARKGNSKGNRLREYIKLIGVTAEQLVAIGDNHNDISMLKFAGMGVTLKHADDFVKQAADHVINCDNNDEHGLADFIVSLY